MRPRRPGSPLRRLAGAVIASSRERKWRLYCAIFEPRAGERVLDVGASPLVELPWENPLLRRYPFPEQVTAVTLSEGEKIRAAFPGVTVVEADGRDLPFADDEFDVVHSNAVVEHVGPFAEQQRFVGELVRVARSGFVTTPNRWFPIESHCKLPFVHWLPRPIAWRIQHGLGRYDADAWLLSAAQLRGLVRAAGVPAELHRQRLLGWTATAVVTFRKPPAGEHLG